MKWLAVISGILFVVGFVFFFPAAIHRDHSTEWPTATGVVSATGLRLYMHKPHLEPWYTPVVCFTFTVGNVPYIATRIDFHDSVLALRKEDALSWLERNYPVGQAVTVHYAPSNPGDAVLVPGAKDLIFICAGWLVTTAVCGIVSLVMLRARRPSANHAIEAA